MFLPYTLPVLSETPFSNEARIRTRKSRKCRYQKFWARLHESSWKFSQSARFEYSKLIFYIASAVGSFPTIFSTVVISPHVTPVKWIQHGKWLISGGKHVTTHFSVNKKSRGYPICAHVPGSSFSKTESPKIVKKLADLRLVTFRNSKKGDGSENGVILMHPHIVVHTVCTGFLSLSELQLNASVGCKRPNSSKTFGTFTEYYTQASGTLLARRSLRCGFLLRYRYMVILRAGRFHSSTHL